MASKCVVSTAARSGTMEFRMCVIDSWMAGLGSYLRYVEWVMGDVGAPWMWSGCCHGAQCCGACSCASPRIPGSRSQGLLSKSGPHQHLIPRLLPTEPGMHPAQQPSSRMHVSTSSDIDDAPYGQLTTDREGCLP
jgi:hypothetical protein